MTASVPAANLSLADQWLGTGLRFPIRPDPQRGALSRATGMDRIRQSIGQILSTDPGERIMLPGFGCGLTRYVMEPNTLTTRSSMEKDIEAALTAWEPRIRLTSVSVSAGDDPGLVWIEIAYQRLSDQRPDNLVYPFYLK
jgi:phage baseplate assembly protein W